LHSFSFTKRTKQQQQQQQHHAYKLVLVKFMTYRDNVAYSKTHEFSKEQLLKITPHQVGCWMCMMAFGTETPEFPTRIRVSAFTLEYWKKAISSFMPNKHMPWDCISNEGNPTRSQEVQDVIKAVKKFEVRRVSLAPQPFSSEEMRQVSDYMRKY
jgi:uncharacterized protein (DUF2267 family)